MTIVCPACNLRPSSILLAFCSSSTLTLYILAMEVSVSPRATVCVFPLTGEDGDPPEAPPVGAEPTSHGPITATRRERPTLGPDERTAQSPAK